MLYYDNASFGEQSEFTDEEVIDMIKDWMFINDEFNDLTEQERIKCENIILEILKETDQFYHPCTNLYQFDDEDIEYILDHMKEVE